MIFGIIFQKYAIIETSQNNFQLFINWQNSAKKIHDKIRGLYLCPSASAIFNDIKIKIIESEIPENKEIIKNTEPGEIIDIIKDGIKISTGAGVILVKKVQPPGKKPMNAFDWCNGARIKPGDKFNI